MFQIKAQHETAFASDAMRRFTQDSILFLLENAASWAETKNSDELQAFVTATIEFAQKCGLTTEISIQRLLILRLNYDLDVPFNAELLHPLQAEHLDEAYRLDQLERQLSGIDKLIPITLDSDLDALRSSRD